MEEAPDQMSTTAPRSTPGGNLKKIFRGDPQLWGIFFSLVAISILEVFSASSTLAYKQGILGPIMQHGFFVVLSIFFVFLVSRLPGKFIHYAVPLIYLVAVALQAFVFFNGDEINSASRWITIFGIRFQPSEIIKPAMVMMGAAIFTSKGWGSLTRRFYWYLGLMALPIFLIAADNLSTAVILLVFSFLFAWVCGAPKKPLLKSFLVISALGLVSLIILISIPSSTLEASKLKRANTWRSRIVDKLNFGEDSSEEITNADADYVITDDNFQESHAKIAIARSRGIGVGPGNSLERDILPQAFSDYIWAITIEEYGIFGLFIIPLMYMWFFWRLSKIGGRIKNPFYRYLLLGFGLVYLIQALTNLAVAAGVFPVTGQTLPLISRGGTSYLITSFSFGIMIAISRYAEPPARDKRTPLPAAISEAEEMEIEREIEREELAQQQRALSATPTGQDMEFGQEDDNTYSHDEKDNN